MSKINIKNIIGHHNIIGDHNNVINSANTNVTTDNRVLIRDDYHQIIKELRELERISLGDYLSDKFNKHAEANPHFLEILYKDIHTILKDTKEANMGDLMIENGDFVLEYGDIKLSGHQTNLDYALNWLRTELVEKFTKNTSKPEELLRKIELFEDDFIGNNYNTADYQSKLDQIKESIIDEGKVKSKSFWTKWFDVLELKPNLWGIGLDLKKLIKKMSNQ